MSKTLVLITTAFPFGRGEQFLESEVDILATQFDRIVVVPQKKTGEARSLPENFFVDKGFATLVSKDGALKRVALAIFYWAKNNNIFPLKSADIKSHLVASYYAYRSGQYFYKLCESLRSKDGAVVFYSYWFYPVVVGLVDIKKKYKMDGLSIVTRAHGSDVYEAVHGISEFPFRRRVINCLTRVFCISDNGAEHIRKKYGAKNVEVSRLGSREPRSVPGSGNGVATIVSCSSINSIKRVSRIFDVVNLLAKENPGDSIEWVHIGSGPLEESLRLYIQQRAESNLVVTLKGFMGNDDVHGFYEQNYVDCFINLSTSEGVPVSIMEAMSYGIPVVATRVGGVPEIVESGAGILVDVDATLSDVSQAVLNLLKKSRDGSARAAARRVWMQKYNAAKNYRDFANTLASL